MKRIKTGSKEAEPGEMAKVKRIIVVDDDWEMREIVAFALRRLHFDVVSASNGQELQQLLALQLPDLVILDVVMPDEDGYHIFDELRAAPLTRQIPVIIMTAHAEEIYERISADLGAANHITKPFHPLELVAMVQNLFPNKAQN
jgi:DNA-binding response OmpR family regulator